MLLPMFKILLTLLLVTTASLSAPDDSILDINKEFEIIFGNHASVPPGLTTTDGDKNANEEKPCRIEHQVGKCIPYYLCEDKIEESAIDLAFGDPEERHCDSYIDSCCRI